MRKGKNKRAKRADLHRYTSKAEEVELEEANHNLVPAIHGWPKPVSN